MIFVRITVLFIHFLVIIVIEQAQETANGN
jgi:hypothetical protein